MKTSDGNTVSAAPLVSVCMITFNHEKFISQAIESVLSQKCNFQFELVIGEDLSTDNTKKIIRQFEQLYPGIIKPVFNESNIGMTPNFIKTIDRCRGKYIAFLEGDDYWSDSGKLQKQVDYLEEHGELSGVCHNLNSYYEENGNTAVRFTDNSAPGNAITLKDMFHCNWASTPTVMVRRAMIVPVPAEILGEKVADYFLWCYSISKAPFGYIPEVMAVYRVHAGGVWSRNGLRKRLEKETDNMIRANRLFCREKKMMKLNVEQLQLQLIDRLEEEGLRKEAVLYGIWLMITFILKGKFNRAGEAFNLFRVKQKR